MKAVRPVIPLVLLLLTGCDESSKLTRSAPSADRSGAASAPADYLKSAGQAKQRAVKTIDVAAINKAIESFYVQEGRFPKSLDELEDKAFVRAVPLPPAGMKLNYDTNDGVVTLEKDLGSEPGKQ
jgi:hypothetical protein